MPNAPKDRDVIATAAQVDNPSYQDNLKVRRDPDGSLWVADAQGNKVGSLVPSSQKALGATISDGGSVILGADGTAASAATALINTSAAGYSHSAFYSGVVLPRMNWNPGGRFALAVLGDSIGEGALASVTQSAWNTAGWVGKLRAALWAMGYLDGGEGFIPLTRVEWAKVGAWSQIGDNGPSGQCWTATADTSKTWTLTTNSVCDNADIIYIDSAGAGAFQVVVDGEAPITITPPGLNNNKTIAANISLGSLSTHTIVVKGPASGTLYFNGAAVYRGAAGLVIHNLSKSGATAADFGYKASQRIALLSVLTPRISILGALANDYGAAQTPIATYRTNLSNTATECAKYGRVLGFVPPDNGLSTAGKSIAVADYEAALKDVIRSFGGGTLDIHAAWGAYADNASKMYDAQHPNAAGHIAISQLYTQLCMSLGA